MISRQREGLQRKARSAARTCNGKPDPTKEGRALIECLVISAQCIGTYPKHLALCTKHSAMVAYPKSHIQFVFCSLLWQIYNLTKMKITTALLFRK